MAKIKSFSLYLAKPSVADFDDLLTDKARHLLESGEATKSTSPDFGDGAAAYVFPGNRFEPDWVRLLRPSFTMPPKLFSQSPCALLAFKKNRLTFATSFSFAHVYIDDAKTESDFGLKVAINFINDEKLRSVERSNIGAAIRDFAQAAGQRDLRSFGFDDALDLIRKISGQATDSDFADRVTGSRPLRFSKRIEIKDLPAAAIEATALFKSDAYKKTSFKIIDFLSPVGDPELIHKLDAELVSAIRDESDDFEIAIPEILPENIGSFRFERAGINTFHPDLSLELYREGLGDDLPDLTIDDLGEHCVTAHTDDDERPTKRWPVYRSLVGSIVFEKGRYALNEGSWYRIDTAYKDAADRKFTELCCGPDKKLEPLKKIAETKQKGQKTKVHYQSEASYNKEMAEKTGYLLLDGRFIQIDERPGPGIEACDLLDIDGRRFIHVKKSSRQSSVLSHFFKQGCNSAQLIRKYERFKPGLIAVVKEHYGKKKAQELELALNSRGRWTIEFQIADFPRPDGTHNIPFFSKLTLREEARNMEAMGFDVNVRFITLNRRL